MPDQFYIPQRTPAAPQFQPPTGLIESYLNAPSGYETARKNIGQGIDNLVNYQLNEQKAKAGAFEAGGPYLMNLLYGKKAPGAPAGGTNGIGASLPSNGAAPQGSAQTLQGQTAQPSGVPETIQRSLDLGHPDFHSLSSQAAQYSGMGKYGQNMLQNIKGQADLSMMPLTAEEKEASIRASNAKFATPEQGQAIVSGDPSAVANAYGGQAPIDAYNNAAQKKMEVQKSVAGEVGKQGESVSNIGQIENAIGRMEQSLKGSKPYPGANLAGKVVDVMGTDKPFGLNIGDQAANDVNDAGKMLKGALASELTKSGRFTPYIVDSLTSAMVPTAKESPSNRAQKIQRSKEFLQVLKSGNQQNISNMVAAMTGKPISQAPAPIQSNDRITVVSPTGQVGHIPKSQLKEAMAEGYRQQ